MSLVRILGGFEPLVLEFYLDFLEKNQEWNYF